jgi:hypothetical protein
MLQHHTSEVSDKFPPCLSTKRGMRELGKKQESWISGRKDKA